MIKAMWDMDGTVEHAHYLGLLQVGRVKKRHSRKSNKEHGKSFKYGKKNYYSKVAEKFIKVVAMSIPTYTMSYFKLHLPFAMSLKR